MSIDIDLFAAPYAPSAEVAAALAGGQATLAQAATAALRESASFSETYLSDRKAAQIAEQATERLCDALRSPDGTMAALERVGRDLAVAGLLRESMARLTVAWADTAIVVVREMAPAQLAEQIGTTALLLNRVTAAVQAGFEEGRRLRILEQQAGMRAAFDVALAEHEEQERRLLDLIQELSTPVVPVMEGILVLPLIGAIDSRRADQITQQVLHSIERERAQTIIMDITGVVTVDTQTAQVLLRAAQAARLLGTESLLVGITPEVAQTIIGLGLEMRGVRTFADLQSGVMYALHQRGLRITSTSKERSSSAV